MSTQETELKSVLQNETPETIKVNHDKLEVPQTILANQPIEKTDIDKDCLATIASTQQELSQVKKSLSDIIDSLAENPSLFSRAASYWGELPLWQKIAGGITLSFPTLAAGVAANVGILLAISGATVIGYTASGIVLEDHNLCSVDIRDRLKKGIFIFADALEITITALETIRKKFTEEIEKFKVQNLKLIENICTLSDQVESLSDQIECFVATEKLLRNTKDELEKTAESLKNSLEQQNELTQANQKELDLVKHAYEKSQNQLGEKIVELSLVRVSLGLEIDKASKITSSLQGALQALTGAVIGDDKHRVAFQNKLNNLLSNSETSFDRVADQMCHAEEQLMIASDEIKQSNERFKELLVMQEQQVARLESIDNHIISERLVPKEGFSELLSSKGFYGGKRESMPLTDSSQPTRTI